MVLDIEDLEEALLAVKQVLATPTLTLDPDLRERLLQVVERALRLGDDDVPTHSASDIASELTRMLGGGMS